MSPKHQPSTSQSRTCPQCEFAPMVPGTINFAGVREVLFSPDSGSWLKSFVGSGPRVTAHACQQCGHLSLEVSALALNTHLNDDRFRCRRCEHMLRDPAAANCDRCGETI